MDIIQEVHQVENKLKTKVDLNLVFTELETYHKNNPRCSSQDAVRNVLQQLNTSGCADDLMELTRMGDSPLPVSLSADSISPDPDNTSIISLHDSEDSDSSMQPTIAQRVDTFLEHINVDNNDNKDMDSSQRRSIRKVELPPELPDIENEEPVRSSQIQIDSSDDELEPLYDPEVTTDPVIRDLARDTDKVFRLVKKDGINKERPEIMLYLESHLNEKNRVQIVVEELVGMSNYDVDVEEPTSPPPRSPPPLAYEGKGKGKGKGKSSRKSASFGCSLSEEEKHYGGSPESKQSSSSTNIQAATITAQEKRHTPEWSSDDDEPVVAVTPPTNKLKGVVEYKLKGVDEYKLKGVAEYKPKAADNLKGVAELKAAGTTPAPVAEPFHLNDGEEQLLEEVDQLWRKKPKNKKRPVSPNLSSTVRYRRQRSASPLTQQMLHGPFDFKAHRAGTKPSAPASNVLRPELDALVRAANVREKKSRPAPVVTSPSKHHRPIHNDVGGPTQTKRRRTRWPSPVKGRARHPSTPPGRIRNPSPPPGRIRYPSPPPGRIGHPSPPPDRIRHLSSPLRILTPPPHTKFALTSSPPPRGERMRSPPIHLPITPPRHPAQQRINSPQRKKNPRAMEKAELVNNLVDMFPDTSKEYIDLRAEDLIGKPAALERFTIELLENPQPPPNWRQLYNPQNGDDVMIVENPFVRGAPAPPLPDTREGPAEPLPREDEMDEVDGIGVFDVPRIRMIPRSRPAVAANPPMDAAATTDEVSLRATDGNAPRALGILAGAVRTPSPPVAPDTALNPPKAGPSTQAPALPPPNNQEPLPGTPAQNEDAPEAPEDCLETFLSEKDGEMRSLFPDLSPDWLNGQIRHVFKEMANVENLNHEELKTVYASKIEAMFNMSKDDMSKLPTRKDWEKKQREAEELHSWTDGMTLQVMLDLFEGDPVSYFNDDKRVVQATDYQRVVQVTDYQQCVLAEMKNKYRHHLNTTIEKAVKQGKGLLVLAHKILKNKPKDRKTRRTDIDCRLPPGIVCLQFLKEKKYVELEDEIIAEMQTRQKAKEESIEEARAAGLLKECQCCYVDDCLEIDMIVCKTGHMYCKECVSRGASVAIGDGKTVIECLGQCSAEISWQELQRALAPNVLSKLLQKQQAQEVTSAVGMDGLVTCPFCPYLTIMENENDKVLACKNPDCGRESCRLCKEPNHVPLRCEEVENSNEEMHRKKIEEKLSQAMIRECPNPKCGAKFMKEEGCNKMTCPKCHTKMCYLCKKEVKDYTHFYGQGGAPTPGKTCPLWSDSASLHEKEVAQAAKKAREELADANIVLKDASDPTKGIPDPETIKPKKSAIPGPFGFFGDHAQRHAVIRDQQHAIEQLIRNRAGGPHWGAPAGVQWDRAGNVVAQGAAGHHHGGAAGHHHGGAAGHHHGGAAGHHHGGDVFGMMARMGEIYRLREEGRAQQRRARRAEVQAMRDINNWGVEIPHHPPQPVFLPQQYPAHQPYLRGPLVHHPQHQPPHPPQNMQLNPTIAHPQHPPHPIPPHHPAPPQLQPHHGRGGDEGVWWL